MEDEISSVKRDLEDLELKKARAIIFRARAN